MQDADAEEEAQMRAMEAAALEAELARVRRSYINKLRGSLPSADEIREAADAYPQTRTLALISRASRERARVEVRLCALTKVDLLKAHIDMYPHTYDWRAGEWEWFSDSAVVREMLWKLDARDAATARIMEEHGLEAVQVVRTFMLDLEPQVWVGEAGEEEKNHNS